MSKKPLIISSEITDVELIVENQLARLKDAAMLRPLSLEEVKILDFLHKNLVLAKKEKGEAIDVTPTEEMSEADLLAAVEPKKVLPEPIKEDKDGESKG